MRVFIQAKDIENNDSSEFCAGNLSNNPLFDDLDVQVVIEMGTSNGEAGDTEVTDQMSVKEIVDAYETGNVPLNEDDTQEEEQESDWKEAFSTVVGKGKVLINDNKNTKN